MKVDIQEVSSCKKTLKIEIPPEDVNAEIEKAYDELRTNAPVRGFRKGKAPRGVLKMRFGEFIKGDVLEKLILPSFEEAVKDAQLEILRPLNSDDIKPPMDELSVEEDQPLSFEVTIDVKPKITLPDFNQLEIEKGDVNVTQEDVDKLLEKLRERRADFIPVEGRPVQKGDYVTLSLLAKSNDEVLEDKKEAMLEVGEGSAIPEINEHIIGMNVGDEKEFSINMPEDHKIKSLAGKEVKFSVKLGKVSEKKLPPLDDDFAKDLDEEDMQHLKAKAWNELVESERENQKRKQENDILKQLVEKIEFEVPDFFVEGQAKIMMASDRQMRAARGIELPDEPEDISEYLSTAQEIVKQTWIIDEIIKTEKMEATDEDVEARVKEIAESQDKDPQKYMKLMEAANRLDSLRASILNDKVFDFLIENASQKRTLII